MEHRSFSTDLVVPDDNNACGNQRAGEPAPNVAQEELLEEKQVGGPVNCSASELCTFLAGLEAGFLPTYYSDTSPSVQLKSMSIASRSYRRGKKTVVFHGFPSLQMSRNLTGSLGEEWLTWFLEASRARTSAAPARAQELPANDPAFGGKWHASFARWNPDTSSWRTPQCSLFEDLELSLETWPRWGSMRNGECWERMPLAQTTSESESGYWPTPMHGPRDASCTMETALKWDGIAKQDSLSFAVAREEKADGRHMPHGQLNPPWVEWLMGWPIGWTDLKPLAMDKFQQWWRLHGGF